jgi:hypothetical protein
MAPIKMTFICGQNAGDSYHRKITSPRPSPSGGSLRKSAWLPKLKAIKAELQRRLQDRTSQVGELLRKVVTGYYQYHAVSDSIDQLRIFRKRVNRLWRNLLVRRSQRAQKKWEKFTSVFERWIPPPGSCTPILRLASTPPILHPKNGSSAGKKAPGIGSLGVLLGTILATI